MTIIKSIKCCFQIDSEITKIYDIETESNWDYSIELERSVMTDKLANFLNKLELERIEYRIDVEPTDETWRNYKLVIYFPKKEGK